VSRGFKAWPSIGSNEEIGRCRSSSANSPVSGHSAGSLNGRIVDSLFEPLVQTLIHDGGSRGLIRMVSNKSKESWPKFVVPPEASLDNEVKLAVSEKIDICLQVSSFFQVSLFLKACGDFRGQETSGNKMLKF
jgi:hypothetical protein